MGITAGPYLSGPFGAFHGTRCLRLIGDRAVNPTKGLLAQLSEPAGSSCTSGAEVIARFGDRYQKMKAEVRWMPILLLNWAIFSIVSRQFENRVHRGRRADL